VRELLERIPAGVGLDARVEREEDAEGASAEFVGEDLRASVTRNNFCLRMREAPVGDPEYRGYGRSAAPTIRGRTIGVPCAAGRA
jgi:hypothetical protein